jgi:MFS family permease
VPVERTSRRAWLVWVTAIVIYAAAVFHRTSLGVAGMAASQRFDIGPAALSIFTVLQVVVYSAMQIPTGVLVDRIGPRRTLVAAAILLGLGQALFAIAADFPLALLARAVLGIGDAMTWVSVLRLVAVHFPARRYALVVSLSAAIGAFGNFISTVPLTELLRDVGWTTTFFVAGAATTVYAVFAARRLHDGPAATPQADPPATSPAPENLRTQVGRSWQIPGTRLGFWLHFSGNAVPITLGLLWGMPYLVQAQGLSVSQAGSLLGLLVIGSVVGGPIIGAITGRRPEHRMPLAVTFLALAVVLWTAVVAWPGGHPPLTMLVVVFGLLSLGGPTAGIGFSLARDYTPPQHVGTATGVVNLGGFTATTIAASSVGVLLQLTAGDTAPHAYRIALLAVCALLALGKWRTLIWWRRARAEVFAAEARGEDVPVRLRARRWDIRPELQPA